MTESLYFEADSHRSLELDTLSAKLGIRVENLLTESLEMLLASYRQSQSGAEPIETEKVSDTFFVQDVTDAAETDGVELEEGFRRREQSPYFQRFRLGDQSGARSRPV
jgi:hypothetical protein